MPRFVLFLSGADDRTRTGTELPPRDFKSLASAISPHRLMKKGSCAARTFIWRHHPDLNWGLSFCRALPYHLAMVPYLGAGDGTRTRGLRLGKATLYQLSHSRMCIPWWEQQGSNLWPPACKADALPAELCSHVTHTNIPKFRGLVKGFSPSFFIIFKLFGICECGKKKIFFFKGAGVRLIKYYLQ